MPRRRLGTTAVDVPVLCLGSMTFGTPLDQQASTAVVEQALSLGIDFFDTADIYEGYARSIGSAGGVSERYLGSALRGHREHVLITSKVGNSIGDDRYRGKGLSRDHIFHQIDASLDRLETNYLDFYQMHVADPDTPLRESVEAMVSLLNDGKVRHWGFSNFSGDQVKEMIKLCRVEGWPLPEIAQPAYSWLQRDLETDYLPACCEQQIGLTPYRALEGGILSGKYRREVEAAPDSRMNEHPEWLPMGADFDRIETFEEEARSVQRSPLQHALRWVLDQPGVASLVVGVRKVEQLDELCAAVQ